MGAYEETDCPHGTPGNALSHIKGVVEALEFMPWSMETLVEMKVPMRDRALAFATRPLRKERRVVRVFINPRETAWEDIDIVTAGPPC